MNLVTSSFTTDVEFSLRTWSRDERFLRFLGITAMHTYRAVGGHQASSPHALSRAKDTDAAIMSLVTEFPELLSFDAKKKSCASVKYRFLAKGPSPWKVQGLYNARGRRPKYGTKALTDVERQRQCRARPKAKSKARA